MHLKSTALFAFVLVVGYSVADTRIDFFLSARNLPAKDPFNGAPDAFVKVYYAPSDFDAYALVGKTKAIDNTHNPDWAEQFNFYLYDGGSTSNQKIKLEIIDSDYDFDDDIGTIEFKLNALVSQTDLTQDILPKGNGSVRIISKINASFAQGQSVDERFNYPPTQIISFPSHLPEVVAAHYRDEKV